MRRPIQAKKRRVTLTLPADLLGRAKRIARARNTTLSTVISEFLAEGWRSHVAAERSEAVLSAYRSAFSGFSEEEIAVLDGVILRNS